MKINLQHLLNFVKFAVKPILIALSPTVRNYSIARHFSESEYKSQNVNQRNQYSSVISHVQLNLVAIVLKYHLAILYQLYKTELNVFFLFLNTSASF